MVHADVILAKFPNRSSLDRYQSADWICYTVQRCSKRINGDLIAFMGRMMIYTAVNSIPESTVSNERHLEMKKTNTARNCIKGLNGCVILIKKMCHAILN